MNDAAIGVADLDKNNGNDDDDDDANNEVEVEREPQTSIDKMIHWRPATSSVHDRAKVDSLAAKNKTKYCRINNYISIDRIFKIYIIIF